MCIRDRREHYQHKLQRANNLYMELTGCLLQLEKREQQLIKCVIHLNLLTFDLHILTFDLHILTFELHILTCDFYT